MLPTFLIAVPGIITILPTLRMPFMNPSRGVPSATAGLYLRIDVKSPLFINPCISLIAADDPVPIFFTPEITELKAFFIVFPAVCSNAFG